MSHDATAESGEQSDDGHMPVFGRLLTAMVTPFGPDGGIDHAEAARLSAHLVDDLGNEGLVINGTTGESPTTSDEEQAALLRTVVDAVGDRASVLAGVGTFSTEHSIHLARQAAAAGSDGLLVVSPYYSRPPLEAVEAYHLAVAEATDLPVMLYDIPHRVGVAMPEDLIVRLAAHPNIVAVKDAKGDAVSSSAVIAATTLDYYAGDDGFLLPLLGVGGVGVVGTSTHFSGLQARALIEAFTAGDTGRAVAIHQRALPVFRGVFASQGCMMVKAALNARGWSVGDCRPPMGTVPPALLDEFLAALDLLLED